MPSTSFVLTLGPVKSLMLAERFCVTPVPFTLKPSRPSVLTLISLRLRVIVSPSFAPTCSVRGLAESDSTFTPLKSVCSEMRLMSDMRWLISSCIESSCSCE
ncbi:hypothetical protein D3C85_1609200 [compost metagenome]